MANAKITGPGRAVVFEYKEHLREAAKFVQSIAAELHSSANFHGNRAHAGLSFRSCPYWRCKEAAAYMAKLGELAPSPYRLNGYRARLRKLQKAIKSETPPIDTVP